MIKTTIGFLKRGDIFYFEGNKYRAGCLIEGTNGYVACINVQTHRVKRLHIDLDVEVDENEKNDKARNQAI